MRIAVLSLLLAGASPLLAAVPKVDSIFPAGGQQGSEFEVSVAGQLEPWPLAATCDEPRIQFTPDEKEKGKFRVVVAGEVDPGAYLVWFSNNDGVSLPRLFVIGLEAELEQAGPEPMLVPVKEAGLVAPPRLVRPGLLAGVSSAP